MCGITGWVDFERDLTTAGDTIHAMTSTLARRGPDGEGSWIGSHAALGVRRLAVIDVQGGQQPMVVEHDDKVVAVLVYSGEIYNFRELREELGARGHRFRTTSDTEVVLDAYLEWREGCVKRLNGIFAFAVWSVLNERLLLARDPLGVFPLYYYPLQRGVLFGSEPKAILANPLVQAAVDADGLRELMSLAKTPGLAVFQGMRELRPGHILGLNRDGMTEHRYWSLRAKEHVDDLKTTVRVVRDLLEDIIERQIVSDAPLCTLLSGGLDSSAITALAARALRGQGAGDVRTFAVDFVNNIEHFRSDSLRQGGPDSPYVAEMVRHVGAKHTDVILDTADLMDPNARSEALCARDLPSALGDLYTSLYLLCRVVKRDSKVSLTGDGADELFGGYAWFHNQEWVYANTFPWVAASRHPSHPRLLETGLLEPSLRDKLDVQGYEAARYADALAEVPHLDGETGHERRMREICYLNLTRYLQIILDRKDRMGMAVGLEGRVPFCDQRLVAYLFNAPWTMKIFDGREKSLLRAATEDLLPRSIVERVKAPFPLTRDPAYEQALRHELAKLIADTTAPVRSMLDLRNARSFVDASAGPPTMHRSSIEMVLELNAWLDQYAVRVSL